MQACQPDKATGRMSSSDSGSGSALGDSAVPADSASAGAAPFVFSAADAARFARDGFLVVPGFWSPATTAAVKAAAERLLDEYDPLAIPRFRFSAAKYLNKIYDFGGQGPALTLNGVPRTALFMSQESVAIR